MNALRGNDMNGDNEKKSLESRASTVRMIYTVISLYVLTTIFFMLPATPNVVIGLTMLVSMCFIAPVSTVVLWFLNRPCRKIHTVPQRCYLAGARIILFLGWMPDLWFGLFLLKCALGNN